MKNLLRRLQQDEQGAALLEYTVLLGVMLGAVIVAVLAVGTHTGAVWTGFNTLFQTVPIP